MSLINLKIDQIQLRSLLSKLVIDSNKEQTIEEAQKYLQISPQTIKPTSQPISQVVRNPPPSLVSTGDMEVRLLSVYHSQALKAQMKSLSSSLPSTWNSFPTPQTPGVEQLMASFLLSKNHEVGVFFFLVENDFNSFVIPYFGIQDLSLMSLALGGILTLFKEYSQFHLPSNSPTSFPVIIKLTFLNSADSKVDEILISLGFQLEDNHKQRIWKLTTTHQIDETLNPFQKINQLRVYSAAKGARGRILNS